MRVPSASKLGLSMRCSYPWSPNAPAWPAYTSSEAAEHGNAVHALADSIVNGRQHDTTPEAEAYRKPIAHALERLSDLARAIGQNDELEIKSERAIAWQAHTGKSRYVTTPSHRAYPVANRGELMGTADLIIIAPGYAMVADWKSGRGAREEAAADSWQLKMLGLALARLLGLDSVDIALVHLEPHDFYIDRATLDIWDLDAAETSLEGLVDELERGIQEPVPGPHCRNSYCPVISTCPATRAAVTRVEEQMRTRLPMLAEIEDDEQARAWRVGLKLVDEYVKSAKARLNDYVSARGAIELAPGLWYGVRKQTRDSIDLSKPGAVAAVLESVGPSALDYSTSKEAIERAAKAAQEKRGDGARKAAELVERLREMGAVKESTFSTPREFRRNEDKENAA